MANAKMREFFRETILLESPSLRVCMHVCMYVCNVYVCVYYTKYESKYSNCTAISNGTTTLFIIYIKRYMNWIYITKSWNHKMIASCIEWLMKILGRKLKVLKNKKNSSCNDIMAAPWYKGTM